jgi:hypothetical protein
VNAATGIDQGDAVGQVPDDRAFQAACGRLSGRTSGKIRHPAASGADLSIA